MESLIVYKSGDDSSVFIKKIIVIFLQEIVSINQKRSDMYLI